MNRVGEMEAAGLRDRHYNAVLTRIRVCNPMLWVVGVRPSAGLKPFRPGQYTTLGLGLWEPRIDADDAELIPPGQERKLLLRAYSFSHPVLDGRGGLVDPAATDEYEFYITLLTGTDEGDRVPHLTPRLFAMEAGRGLYVGNKVTGHYTLEGVSPDEDVIFAATGTGEAPHNPMIWHLLRTGHRGRIVSVLCSRYEADQGYREVHRRLQELYPAYTYITLTTREPGNAGRKLYLQEFVGEGMLEDRLGWRLDPEKAHVFLCGNPSMIGIPHTVAGRRTYPEPRGLIEILERRGFNADPRTGARVNIHFEKYW